MSTFIWHLDVCGSSAHLESFLETCKRSTGIQAPDGSGMIRSCETYLDERALSRKGSSALFRVSVCP